MRLISLTVALLVLSTGCSTPNAVELGSDVRVELDAFSGLPNPSWELAADQVAEVRRRLDDLPEADRVPPPDNLGYRGFALTDAVRGESVYVGGGKIHTAGAKVATYVDVHDLEEWLIDDAKARGYQGVFSQTKAEN